MNALHVFREREEGYQLVGTIGIADHIRGEFEQKVKPE